MKVGLALSGGGARGFAHLGVLKALEEAGIKVDMLSGASAGSVAAAFYAYGYGPEETLKIFENTNILKLVWPAFSVTGLLNIQKTESVYKRYLEEDSFENSEIPLYIAATNLNEGKAELFNSGSLRQAIMASCCIPFIFDPVKIGNDHYVDGGILNNMPTEILKEKGCDFIIGVNVAPVIKEPTLSGPKRMIERVTVLALSANVLASSKLCDVYIKPAELRSFGTFDFKKSRELFTIGYDYTKDMLETMDNDKLKSLINQPKSA
ncbi:patatin-like phospholipase family protein [Roseivirga sp.]|uniref:patatin-like phospholipase family protein n=1 Tax=Roseivirga sp. TaxID=1964215 RepID=UPI003B5159EB